MERRLLLPVALARQAAPIGKDLLVLPVLVEIINYLIVIVRWLVIVQFVLSLLISFDVVNTRNDFILALWKALNALLEPLLRPIRRIMPDTGAIDFSPMVLIVGLVVLQMLVSGLDRSSNGL